MSVSISRCPQNTFTVTKCWTSGSAGAGWTVPGELHPPVDFNVTNLTRPPEKIVVFSNQRGTCEQWIKESRGAIKWTRLLCRTFAANAVRLQLHALAYNLGNFLRTLATPEPISDWSLTSLRKKLIKIGAKIISHGRYVAFQMAEVANPRHLFADILRLIAELRPPPDPATLRMVRLSCVPAQTKREMCLDQNTVTANRHSRQALSGYCVHGRPSTLSAKGRTCIRPKNAQTFNIKARAFGSCQGKLFSFRIAFPYPLQAFVPSSILR